jgi:hypothetical protein
MKNWFDVKVGDFIHNVAFNSAGGWDWSESFRVTAVSKHFIAAIACGDAQQHNTGHWAAAGGDGFEPQTRIVVTRDSVDCDGVIWDI